MASTENKLPPVNTVGTGNEEPVGLFYGGFVMIGMAVGAFVGFMIGGGQEEFLAGGWIDSVIGVVTGLFIGVGLGLISHGVFLSKRWKK
ncbi:MAG: hypothetical protein LBB74_04085 [Chitinispirillales bacterium]|jgi:hypothetical protein|nr:hypothetical protein [Chitinispirillales bacterium]